MIHFDKKQLLKAYDLLLFQKKKKKKKMALIFGVVHESQSGPVLCYLQKQFSKVLVSYHFFFFSRTTSWLPPNIVSSKLWINSSNSISTQWKSKWCKI